MTDEAIFQDTSTTMQFKKSVIRINQNNIMLLKLLGNNWCDSKFFK
jgi:hypothetical protein